MVNQNLTNQQLLALIQAHREEIDNAKLRLARENYLDEEGNPQTITDACWLACLAREAIAYDKHQLRQDTSDAEAERIEQERNQF